MLDGRVKRGLVPTFAADLLTTAASLAITKGERTHGSTARPRQFGPSSLATLFTPKASLH
jgi:hypothetical protein